MKEEYLNEIKEDEKDLINSRQATMFSFLPVEEDEFQKKRMKFIKSDPYKTNFFSKLFFLPGLHIIRYIREGLPLPTTLGSLKRKNMSKHYSKKLINQWNHTKNKQLLKIILRANMWPLIFILIGGLIQQSLTIISVELAKSLISAYTNKQKDISSGYYFLIIHLFLIFFSRKLNEYQINTGYKMGYQLDCLIYSKLMYSKNFKKFISKNKNIITNADIVNYIEIDSYKLINCILTIPTFVVLPISLIIYFYIIFGFFKSAFFYGLVIFIVFMLTNFIFLSKFRHHQSQEQKNKDLTMKITIKTLSDIENIKLNAEEIDYIKQIYQNKDREMSCYSSKCLVNNINSAILWFVPIAMIIITIFVFQYTDKENINVENIYTLLNILIQINGPIRNIPGTLRTIYETWVSIRRIGNFLKIKDKNESITYYEKNNIDLINKRIMIKIDNGFFTWGKQKNENKDLNGDDNKNDNENNNLNNEEKNKDSFIINTESNSSNNKNENIIEEKIENDEEEEKKVNSLKEEPLIPLEDQINTSENVNENRSLDKSVSSSSEGKATKSKLYDFIELEMPLEDPETTNTEIVLKNINLTIKKGELVLIYGKSGSGKSSLLEAILNEMEVFITQENRYKIITTINGSTSYSSQIPFIYNSTIRQNITFDLSEKNKFNQNRYLKVIDICSLREDLSEFNGGDLTEIGENGINLSSGQKRRIAIARCLYAKKDIYLLDQPTYNLDKIVGMKILVDGVHGFLKNKTRIVVTNKEEFAQYADKIIVLKNGEMIFNGNYYDLTHNEKLQNEGFNFIYKGNINIDNINIINNNNVSTSFDLSTSNPSISHSDTNITTSTEDIKYSKSKSNDNEFIFPNVARQNTKYKIKELTYKTTIDEKVSKYRYKKFIFKAPIPFLEGYKLIIMACFIILEWQLTINGSDLWMVFWNRKQGQGLLKNWRYLVVYASFGLLGAFCVYFRNRFTTKSTNNFVKNLNFHMAYNLVKAPINTFYNQTPTSQIINRLSFDLNNVEDNFFKCWVNIIAIGTSLVIRMGIYIYFFWGSIFIFVSVSVLFILLSFFYVKSARELSRIECSIRTPLINFCGETTLGKSTIKAFDVVGDFLDEFYVMLDKLYKCRLWINLSYQWFGLILSLFSFTLDLFFIMESIYGDLEDHYGIRPEIYGLLLNYLFTFREELEDFQSSFSDIQGVSVSFERANEYNNIFSENYQGNKNDEVNNDDLDEQVFKKGKITFEEYSFKYKLNEKLILNDINFTINPGEKIGIIGRTGGGKSTFIYAITRMVEPFAGKIMIDDIDISTLPLQVLRKNICVLCQNNAISEGTLLSNLDPLNKYTQEEIIKALEKLDFWFNKDENQNYGLNAHIEESGSNLTLAEKSMIAVTKLLLKKYSSVIILEDLSSCLDIKTQKIVYEAIYNTFPESTIIILTHEIKDFMKIDKVMSIQNGEIMEFGKLEELEQDKSSYYNLFQGNKFLEEKGK